MAAGTPCWSLSSMAVTPMSSGERNERTKERTGEREGGRCGGGGEAGERSGANGSSEGQGVRTASAYHQSRSIPTEVRLDLETERVERVLSPLEQARSLANERARVGVSAGARVRVSERRPCRSTRLGRVRSSSVEFGRVGYAAELGQ